MPPRPSAKNADPLVSTSVRLPRSLLKRARVRAANNETTLQALMIKSLQTELDRLERSEQRRRAPAKPDAGSESK